MIPLAAVGRLAVRVLDAARRRYYGVFPFSDDPRCILRLRAGVSHRCMELKDGTRLARNEPILVLHFWNERLPPRPREGATLAWGIAFARHLRRSLRDLAAYVEGEPCGDAVRALYAEFGFVELDRFPRFRLVVELLGFDFVAGTAPGWRFWTYAIWANVFSWRLMWTFSPMSADGKHFRHMARGELWMSRRTLIEKYRAGDAERPGARPGWPSAGP